MTALAGGVATDVGQVRSANEDGALVSAFLFAVADGMGGHRGGAVASAQALRALDAGHPYGSAADLVAAVEAANRSVYAQAQQDADLRGMGTTLCAVALVEGPGTEEGRDEHLVVVNVGDSRAYRLDRHGSLEQLTVDHSLVQMMVDDGRIAPGDAEHHPQRNILTRALGIDAEVVVDSWEFDARPGDRYLVCSDGLFGEVDGPRIAAELRRWADPQEAARQLVATANASGGRDNITCAVFDVVDGPVDPVLQTTMAGSLGRFADVPGTPGARGAAGPSPTARTTALPIAVAERRDRNAEAPTPDARLRPPRGVPGSGVVAAPPGPPPTGRPRRFTLRVMIFLLAIVTVVALGVLAVGWYVTRTWFVGADAGSVVIYQGRPGGVLWFDPTVAERSDVPVVDLPAADCDIVVSQLSTTSLDEARAVVDRMRADLAARSPGTPTTVPGAPTTLPGTATTLPGSPPTEATPAPTTTTPTAPAPVVDACEAG